MTSIPADAPPAIVQQIVKDAKDMHDKARAEHIKKMQEKAKQDAAPQQPR